MSEDDPEVVQRDGRWFVRTTVAGEVHEAAASSEAEAWRMWQDAALELGMLIGNLSGAG